MLIGICGASASGKTLFSKKLSELVNRSLVLAQDAYYLDRTGMSFEDLEALNFDHPASFDHDALLLDVKTLLCGKSIQKRSYDYVNHCRCVHTDKLHPQDVIIVEGIHAFYDKRLVDLMDIKIFIDADLDICLARRITRDLLERERSINSIIHQYEQFVRPMYHQFIRPMSKHADFIVNGEGDTSKITEILLEYIRSKTLEVE